MKCFEPNNSVSQQEHKKQRKFYHRIIFDSNLREGEEKKNTQD